MPKLGAASARDLGQHPVPHRALCTNHEIRIELVESAGRLGFSELVAVDHQPHHALAAVGTFLRNNAHREARLGIAEPLKKRTLGLHQASQGKEPLWLGKRGHQAAASKSLEKSVGKMQRGRRSSPAESQRCRYSCTMRRHNCACISIPLSKFLTPPPIRIAIGSTASGTLKVSSRMRSASSSCSWISSAIDGSALSCARRCIVP